MTQIVRKETRREGTFEVRGWKPTRRPPGYVPYIVDNLWEWTRPEGMPNRRHSVFAAPNPESIEVGGEPFRVVIEGPACIAQIEENDAKNDQDCKGLARLVLKLLGKDWPSLSLEDKFQLAPLWAPCLTHEEVESILTAGPLADFKEEIASNVTFWQKAKKVEWGDKLPYECGEVFFEADTWRLEPM